MSNWSGKLSIAKADEDQRIVYGVASVADLVDSDGDIIRPDELEKAAHAYLLRGGTAGEMHERTGIGRPVASLVTTSEIQKKLGGDGSAPVSWIIGFKIDDPEVWAKVKSGELSELSIGGRAVRRKA